MQFHSDFVAALLVRDYSGVRKSACVKGSLDNVLE